MTERIIAWFNPFSGIAGDMTLGSLLDAGADLDFVINILNNLNQIGIKTHLIKRLNMREQLVRLVEIYPVEFIVRNVATGSLTKKLGAKLIIKC